MIEELLTALVVGLLVAFALQFLLTSLGAAAGLSVLAIRAASRRAGDGAIESEAISEIPEGTEIPEGMEIAESAESEAEPDSSDAVSQIGFWAGSGVLLTVNTVLFTACFLAARFSQAQSPVSQSPMNGAIEGIVIWSAYVLLLIWFSSTAVSSVVGSLFSVSMGGFRQMVRPIGALWTSAEPAAVTEPQMIETVRQEIQAALDLPQLQSLIRTELRTELRAELQQLPVWGTQAIPAENQMPNKAAILKLTQFLQDTPPEKLTAKRVDRHLKKFLADGDDHSEAVLIPEIDRASVMRFLMQRQELSEKQREKVMNQIEKTWNEFRRSSQDIQQNTNGNGTEKVRENGSAASEANSDEPSAENSDSVMQQLTATILNTLAEQISNLPIDETTIDRVVQQLPGLLQQAGKPLPTGASLAMLALALSKGKDLLPSEGIDLESIDLQSMKQTVGQTVGRVVERSGMADLNQTVVEQMGQFSEHLRDRSMQQIDQVQQTVQAKVDTLKEQAQQRLQATQKAATIAAWWLFFTVLTGGISAAVAGAVASRVLVS